MELAMAFGVLLSALAVLQCRKIKTAISLLAVQALLLAIVSAWTAWHSGEGHLWLAVAFILIFKAILIPLILKITMDKVGIKKNVERFINKKVSLLLALLLVVISYGVTSRWLLPGDEAVHPLLTASIGLLFLGCQIMIVHKKAIMQGIGLIIIENGVFLLATSLFAGMPLVVELGVFFDMLILAILIGILVQRIQSAFDSLSTDRLNRLKG